MKFKIKYFELGLKLLGDHRPLIAHWSPAHRPLIAHWSPNNRPLTTRRSPINRPLVAHQQPAHHPLIDHAASPTIYYPNRANRSAITVFGCIGKHQFSSSFCFPTTGHFAGAKHQRSLLSSSSIAQSSPSNRPLTTRRSPINHPLVAH
jgi:hypothetical protein